jgi:hypothetical protein
VGGNSEKPVLIFELEDTLSSDEYPLNGDPSANFFIGRAV